MKYNILLLLTVFSLISLVSASPYSSSTGSSPYSYNINQDAISTINNTYNNNTTNIYNNYTYNGSTLTLDDISDVNAPTPSDGESLVWSSSLMKWISDTVISRWIVSTFNGYLYNDADTLYFNETKLNNTIDARSPQSLSNSFDMYFTSSMMKEVDWNFSDSDQTIVNMTIESGEHYIFGGNVF